MMKDLMFSLPEKYEKGGGLPMGQDICACLKSRRKALGGFRPSCLKFHGIHLHKGCIMEEYGGP